MDALFVLNKVGQKTKIKEIEYFIFIESFSTFNNISAILWRSVLFVEETGIPGENHQPVASKCQTVSLVSSIPRLSRVRTHNFSCDMDSLHMPQRPLGLLMYHVPCTN